MPSPDAVAEFLESRRRLLQETVGRTLAVPVGTDEPPLSPKRRDHLLDELTDLYWNDLEWENVTEEERMEGGSLPELTFPGVLALTRGLLQTDVPEDAMAGPEPRPEVVEQFLEFLARRIIELREEASGAPGEEGDRAALELRMTEGLLDRVLVEYHRLSFEDVGSLDEA
jgi:hypothetical protein